MPAEDISAAFDRQLAALTRVAALDERIAALHGTIASSLQKQTTAISAFAKAQGIGVAGGGGGASSRGASPASAIDAGSLERLGQFGTAVGDKLVAAFQRSRDAVLGFTAAASPSDMATWQGSVTMLSASIGETLLPYLEAGSRQLQSWSRQFDALDSGTKQTVARIIVWTGAIGGGVAAARTLLPLVASLGGALRTLGTAAMASPVGAIATLVGVLGTLAVAWGSVGSAAQKAATNQRDAGRVSVTPSQPGAAPAQPRDYTEDEQRFLPRVYREKLRKLADDEAAIPRLPEAKREAERTRIANERQETLTKLERDLPAWLETVPEPYRQRLQKPGITGEQSREVVTEMEKSVSEQLSKAREGQIPAVNAEAETTRRRQAFLDEAAASLKDEHARRLANYYKRVGDPRVAPEPGVGEPEFAGFGKQVAEAREAAVKKAAQAGIEITPTEAKALRGRVEKAPYADRLAPRPVENDAAQLVRQLTAQQSVLRTFSERVSSPTGAGDDSFLRNLRLPVNSRWIDSDFGSLQSNAQLKAVEQDDLSAKLLADEMRRLGSRIGENVDAIRDFIAAQRAASLAGRYGMGAARFSDD